MPSILGDDAAAGGGVEVLAWGVAVSVAAHLEAVVLRVREENDAERDTRHRQRSKAAIV